MLYFNPLSPHGERPAAFSVVDPKVHQISIHSPRMGRDPPPSPSWSPRFTKFQSTLPAWGETGRRARHERGAAISIHSPRMGRDGNLITNATAATLFQSTLPAWGETTFGGGGGKIDAQFQSTLPAWGETDLAQPLAHLFIISIHSPRMGRDK